MPNPTGWVDPLGLACETGDCPGENKDSRLDPYKGTREAARYLKGMGVPRAKRVEYLESFEAGTIQFQKAGESLYGIRFYDGVNARPEGQYLFETFSPHTNRKNLALPPKWNEMTGFRQFQIKPDTPILRGRAANQFGEGSQYIGGAEQIFVLEPWKHKSLINISK